MPYSDHIIELSVIVPTFNEHPNVIPMIESLDEALGEHRWEVIFVDDDSPDNTASQIREIAKRDPRVRVLQRVGRRGLSSAAIEGILASSAPFCAVIDGDLQHDEKLLAVMLKTIKKENLDVVSGSRYVEGGGLGDWQASRAKISKLATRLSRAVLHADLTDPMSGFFMIRRSAFEKRMHNLSGIGFKILLDIFASSKEPLKYRELPYQFRSRQAGESKLDSQAAWEYFMLLFDKLIGHIVPVRFVAFTLVGGAGVFVHMFIVWLMLNYMGTTFTAAQTTATLIAMTTNYTMNNILTYRDMRLTGWDWIKGWVSFTLACSVGALGNIGIATYIFAQDTTWVWASLSGIVVGAVWNYAVTSVYTWKKPKTA
ncbi:Dolichol-phosphate mannosyltransferase homolog [hydrothermal vent metagenome]|uniref:Dolichol-phosphate mannosyltransferase homolog n=1 Tax=hydrothermal vent metagenome TaxID=652676 RepID=A0A3B0WCM3_9ZZZZ